MVKGHLIHENLENKTADKEQQSEFKRENILKDKGDQIE